MHARAFIRIEEALAMTRKLFVRLERIPLRNNLFTFRTIIFFSYVGGWVRAKARDAEQPDVVYGINVARPMGFEWP